MLVKVAGEFVGGPMDGGQIMLDFELGEPWEIGEGSYVQIGLHVYRLENFEREGTGTKFIFER